MERRITMLYAGALGESLSKGVINKQAARNSLKDFGARDDFSKIRELLRLLVALKYPKSSDREEVQKRLDESTLELSERSAKLIEKHEAAVEKLGAALAVKAIRTGLMFSLSAVEIAQLDIDTMLRASE